jgi:hypothetical protein
MPYVNPRNPPERVPDSTERRYQDGKLVREPETSPESKHSPTDRLWDDNKKPRH